MAKELDRKKVVLVAIKIVFWVCIGLVGGWAAGNLEHYRHAGELSEIADIRGVGNMVLGGVFGLFLGVIKVIRS